VDQAAYFAGILAAWKKWIVLIRSLDHWQFIELLKQQGIKYKDRDYTTRIAIRIAKDEL
jgi:hypothetical protein